ncbi:MAG: beta-galactosidase, partial [Muribaculaceae bacterium]|nr:beta-galactosidase [Muribaculaceae bacterium]
ADRGTLECDNQYMAFVSDELIDADGTVVPVADTDIEFSVSGAGGLKAAGSADLTDRKSYTSPVHRTWKGRAMAIVKAGHKKGKATLTARAGKLKAKSAITIR